MTIKEFKNTMQFNLRDTFTYIRDNENVNKLA